MNKSDLANISLLMVEDDLTFSTMLSTWLRKKGFEVCTASSVGAAIKLLRQPEGNVPQLVLSDLRMPDHDGLYLLRWLRTQGMNTPFIIMTSYADVQNAVEAMKLGANDYISKPVQPDLLLQKIGDALSARTQCHTEGAASQSPVVGLPSAPAASSQPATHTTSHTATPPRHPGIEGHSSPARELYRLAALVAPTPMSVLIIGASGTGKEHVAHRIHELSNRANAPFVALDCGSLTKELAASELFGHKKVPLPVPRPTRWGRLSRLRAVRSFSTK